MEAGTAAERAKKLSIPVIKKRKSQQKQPGLWWYRLAETLRRVTEEHETLAFVHEGAKLQAWEASYQPDSAESFVFMFSFQFDCVLTILLFIFGQVFFLFFCFFVTRFKCCQKPAADQSPKYTWHHPEHLRKANRIWQKTGWNWKCSNLLKATGRGNNSWPQSVNKPNVFTAQHRRWKGRRKKKTNLEFPPQQIHLDHWAREFKYKRDTKAVMLKVVRIE